MDTKKLKNLLLKLVVSGGLFALLLSKVNLADIGSKLAAAQFVYLPIIGLLIILNYVVSSMRWKRLLVYPNSGDIKLWYLVSLYFIGSFFNNFMPTSVGGDVFKVVKLGNKIKSKTNAFSATFTERFLGVIALGLISYGGFIKLYGWIAVLAGVLGLVLAVVGIKVLLLLSNKVKIIKKIVDALSEYKNHRSALVYAFVLSFVVQLFAIVSQYLVFSALGYNPPLGYSFLVLPVITLAGFFIPSLNGIGVQDALYVSLFSVVGVPASDALTASILYHILRLLISLIGGILYALGLDD